MNVKVVYVYPMLAAHKYNALAERFVRSYMDHPPGTHPHELVVAVNGGEYRITDPRDIFGTLTDSYLFHNNYGKDIGAYQRAAHEIPCDLLVCLGSNIHFRKTGWLDRIIEVFCNNGPHLYGPWAFHQPKDHIRTTAFWCSPELLKSYPVTVGDGDRYEFEHGNRSIARHANSLGLGCYMVTWGGVFPPEEWHHVTNDQSLILDQHTDSMGYT